MDAINQYKDVKVELSTNEMEESSVSQEMKEDIAEQMGEEKVAAFFDIDLSVKVEGEEVGTITEIEKEIEVTLPIPEKLPEREKRVRRKFYVLRVHDNVVEKLAATVAENGIVFKTDRFSTYVLTSIWNLQKYYQDTAVANICGVQDKETFNRLLAETLEDSEKQYIYEAFQNEVDCDGNVVYDRGIQVTNEVTNQILESQGFVWQKTEEAYIRNYVTYFREMGWLGNE